MAGDAASVCLHAFVSCVCGEHRWWEWTHTCPDREAIETPRSTPPPTTTSPPVSLALWSIKDHIRPLTPLESTLIGWKCSQRPGRNNAQWSVRGRGGEGEREGGRHAYGGERRRRRREGGEKFSTSCPSLHTNPEVERCHNKPGTKRGARFSIWGATRGFGHGGDRSQPLKKEKKKKNSSESGSDRFFSRLK